MSRVILVSARGGQGRDVLDALHVLGCDVIAVLDDWCVDQNVADVHGIPVVGRVAAWADHSAPDLEFALACSSALRRQLATDGIPLHTVIHPRATVAQTAQIGRGAVILAGCVVGPDAAIGEVVILNANCAVDHDCVLEAGVQFGPGVTLAGGVRVCEEAFVGVGATLMPGVTVGAGAVVGAGSVVIRDVGAGVTVAGNPAKPLLR